MSVLAQKLRILSDIVPYLFILECGGRGVGEEKIREGEAEKNSLSLTGKMSWTILSNLFCWAYLARNSTSSCQLCCGYFSCNSWESCFLFIRLGNPIAFRSARVTVYQSSTCYKHAQKNRDVSTFTTNHHHQQQQQLL